MRKALKELVWRRARRTCEYCHMPQEFYRPSFQVDHILAKQHGGTTVSLNLALACYHCNLHKGSNIAGVDSTSGKLRRLFHPRKDVWADHFVWDGPYLKGLTAVGRATIAVLAINDPLLVAVRELLIADGDFPLLASAQP